MWNVADVNDTTEDIYLLQGVMWNGMLYVECMWSGWTTECEVVHNGVVKSVWCEMVA